MAGTFPRIRLYNSTGVSLIYEFENVTDINDWQDPITFAEHASLRGQGSIISEGSNAPWDLNMSFVLIDDDYEALVSQMSSILSTIVKNTKYILKVDLTASTTKDYKVKRLQSFVFPLNNNNKKRVNFQTVNGIFRVDSWA
jgi:hypothetical protein